jgi:hypothetical protein
VQGASQNQEEQQHTDSQSDTTAMRLGSRLTGRALTRSKARGGDGFSSDSELLAAVLQQPASDPTAACKGDMMTRKLDGLPGQVSIHAAALASTRLPLANGTTPPAAPPVPPTVAASASKPKHQRSHSAGQVPKGALQLQTHVANDLACIADTLVKACADPLRDDELPAEPPAGQQRRSARLAAAAAPTVAADSGAGPLTSSKAAGRTPAPRQHKRVQTSNGISTSRKDSAAVAAESPAQPVGGAVSEPGSAARRVRFAPGHLDPEAHPNSTHDGHPASEGALAVPVRRVPVSYGMDLSRGNVLMLEQLLGADCSMSVTRLKRRVGLLPPIRAARPYANSPAAAAASGAHRQADNKW